MGRRFTSQTNMSHLQKLQEGPPPLLHNNITRWAHRVRWDPMPNILWKSIWHLYRLEKENLFLWQIAYQVLASKAWRHPRVGWDNLDTWFESCDLIAYEDIQHILWRCSIALPIWVWAKSLLCHTHLGQHRQVDIQIQHALIFASLTTHVETPSMWWEFIRGACCWLLWKARCSLVMEHSCSMPDDIITRIWHRLK